MLVHFILKDKRNINSEKILKEFGGLYFTDEKAVVNFMTGYLTAIRDYRRNVRLYAFDDKLNMVQRMES